MVRYRSNNVTILMMIIVMMVMMVMMMMVMMVMVMITLMGKRESTSGKSSN